MSKKQPIKIEIEETLNILPGDIYSATVVRSGNGAIIKSYKRYIGKEVVVIMADKIKKKKKKTREEEAKDDLKETMEDYGDFGWEKS